VSLASAACLTARQRLESLERFRDKARLAWEHAVAADEQKQVDALATLRHVAALRESAQRSRT
jgi:flagellar biosynthesis chaperone FliJ